MDDRFLYDFLVSIDVLEDFPSQGYRLELGFQQCLFQFGCLFASHVYILYLSIYEPKLL